MKNKFILCSENLPDYEKLLSIKLTDGSIINAWRTESSFDESLGYLYEDTNYQDHYQKDVIAWQYK